MSKFAKNVREPSAHPGLEGHADHNSLSAAVQSVVVKIGRSAQTMNNSINKAVTDRGECDEWSSLDSDCKKQLVPENGESKHCREIVR